MYRYLLLLVFTFPAAAQETWNTAVPVDILILQSTRSYPAALQTARQAATRLHARLDLGGKLPHAKSGLTMSRAECAENRYSYPTYLARGNGLAEDTQFVSVEYSDAYAGFTPGYYIVVAALGAPGSGIVRYAKTTARTYYPDAYAKRTKVWRGCLD